MDRYRINPTASFNGLAFGSDKTAVRLTLGPNYENSIEERNKNMQAPKSAAIIELENTIAALYKEMGKGEFQWPDISPYIDDCDTYPEFQIIYEDDKFAAVVIWAEDARNFVIGNIDCSDLEIEKLLTLADDFEWIEQDTSWVSYSKQIGIFCPDNKRKVENILFGCEGYYEKS